MQPNLKQTCLISEHREVQLIMLETFQLCEGALSTVCCGMTFGLIHLELQWHFTLSRKNPWEMVYADPRSRGKDHRCVIAEQAGRGLASS